ICKFVSLVFIGCLFLFGVIFHNKFLKDYREGFQPFQTSDETLIIGKLETEISPTTEKTEGNENKTQAFDVLPFPFDTKCFERLPPNLKNNESQVREDFEFLESEEGKQFKKILIYYDPFHNETYTHGIAFGNRMFEDSCCKEKRCFVATTYTNKLPLKEYDALIIHLRGLNVSDLPRERAKHQRWIMLERESPAYSMRGINFYNGVFNWTMTYRRDSDVLSKYGYVYHKKYIPPNILPLLESKTQQPLLSIVKKKTKLAAWLVSHCETLSGREMLVEELQKYIDVREGFCSQMLNIIPIVFGAGDYSTISPPHSYIDARNFESPKKLAEYLLYLSRNEEAYMEYFKLAEMVTYCHLCQKLHEDKEEKIYSDMKDWFNSHSHCKYCTLTSGIRKVPKCYNYVHNINFKRLFLRYPFKKKEKRASVI
ncbi:Alpha-(1,3)-fucosyltransferase C, partial [Armadillidium nasatum]